MSKTIKGYKAYNKGMTCKGMKFEEGKVYETKEAKCCETGFHLCKNPLDVLNYYDLCDSEFSEAEAIGKIDTHKEDSKIATTRIKIGAKLSFEAFVKASVDFALSVCKTKKTASSGDSAKLASSGDSAKLASSGYSAQLASSGDSAQLASSGDSAKLASSGDYAQLEIDGKYSVGAGIGINNTIKGKIGNWITLAEWEFDKKENKYIPLCVKSAPIDGKELKEDVYYKLENGKFKEA